MVDRILNTTEGTSVVTGLSVFLYFSQAAISITNDHFREGIRLTFYT